VRSGGMQSTEKNNQIQAKASQKKDRLGGENHQGSCGERGKKGFPGQRTKNAHKRRKENVKKKFDRTRAKGDANSSVKLMN